VIAVDLPGFGESEMPKEDISISGYADTLDALLDVLGIDSVRLVGNSMGGFIGAELAIRYPARVERLVLAAAAGLSVEFIRTQRKEGLRHRAENIAFFNIGWLASRSPTVARRRRLRSALLLLVAAHPDRLPPPLTYEQVKGSGKPGFSDALDALCSYPIRQRLGEIECPTLIVWGDKDRLVPLKDASVFEELISDARKVIYTDTGHLTMLERPARFNADVREFLQERPGEEQPESGARTFAT
jgi:pimeloyl-ACP methyl ester carboxylesterase